VLVHYSNIDKKQQSSILLPELKQLYKNKTANGSYDLGDSFCLPVDLKKNGIKADAVLFVMEKKPKYSEIDYFLAKIYIKEKSIDSIFFKLATEIILAYVGEIELIKELLKKQWV
jgi:hypothetical protein